MWNLRPVKIGTLRVHSKILYLQSILRHLLILVALLGPTDLHPTTRDTFSGIHRLTRSISACLTVLLCSMIPRPETIESLFIGFRLTGDVRYRNHGWDIFQSIQKHCRLETGGYASLLNVDDMESEKLDKMETFLMVRLFAAPMNSTFTHLPSQSETLKYLYLLFSDATLLSLDGMFDPCRYSLTSHI